MKENSIVKYKLEKVNIQNVYCFCTTVSLNINIFDIFRNKIV